MNSHHLNATAAGRSYTSTSGAKFDPQAVGLVPVSAEFRRVGHPHLEGTGVNFHQSFSGSETDVSTSTENLTPEEQYFLRHTQRQDPPGEENIHQQYHHLQRHLAQQQHQQQQPLNYHTAQISHVSAASSACGRSYDSSSCNTMIVHSDSTLDEKFINDYIYQRSAAASGTTTSYTNQTPSFRQPPPYSSVVSLTPTTSTITTTTSSSSGRNNDPLYSNVAEARAAAAAALDTSVQEITDIPSRYLDNSQVLKHLAKEVRGPLIGASSNPGSSNQLHLLAVNTPSMSERVLSTEEKIKLLEGISSTQQLMDQYHQQQVLLVHQQQQQQLQQESAGLPPPPAYPVKSTGNYQVAPPPAFSSAAGGSHGGSSVSLSHSQPDLSRVDTSGAKVPEDFRSKLSLASSGGKTSLDSGFTVLNDSSSDAKEILDILCQENAMLRMELDSAHRKLGRLQKLEQELSKVRSSQEALVESSDRRENLEKTARQKLQMEVRRLQNLHRLVSEQLDVALAQLNRRDGANNTGPVIAQIIGQNRELRATKERQEVELAAQRDTLQEQRQHIDILDSALTNAQANVVRLEEECRKRASYADKVTQLQRALGSLQSSSEKREQMLMKLRQQQEREIQELKAERADLMDALSSTRHELEKAKSQQQKDDGDVIDNPVDAELRRAKNRVTLLEAEVSMWEQRFLSELRETRAQSAAPEMKRIEVNEQQTPSSVVTHMRSQSQSSTSIGVGSVGSHRGSADAINSFLLRKGHLVATQEDSSSQFSTPRKMTREPPALTPLPPTYAASNPSSSSVASTPLRKSADLGQVSVLTSSSTNLMPGGGSVVRNRVRDLMNRSSGNVTQVTLNTSSGSLSLSALDLNSSGANGGEERLLMPSPTPSGGGMDGSGAQQHLQQAVRSSPRPDRNDREMYMV